MPRSSERTTQASGTQRPARRGSIFGRIWRAALHLICIRGNDGGTTPAAATQNATSATSVHDNLGVNSEKHAPQTTSGARAKSATGCQLQPSTSVKHKPLISTQSDVEFIQRIDASCLNSLPSAEPAAAVQYMTTTPVMPLGNGLSSRIFATNWDLTSTSGAQFLGLPSPTPSIVSTSNVSANGHSPVPVYVSAYSARLMSSRNELSQRVLSPITCHVTASNGYISVNSVSSPPKEYLLSTLAGQYQGLPSHVPSIDRRYFKASSSDVVLDNCSPPGAYLSAYSVSSIYVSPLPIKHLDFASYHLNQILPKIKLLNSTNISPIVPNIELGKGSYGRVDLMTLTGTGQLVAVKTSFMEKYKDPEDAWKSMCLEARVMVLLGTLQAPAFPRVYGVLREGNLCKMVLEFVGNNVNKRSSTLYDVVFNGRPVLNTFEVIWIILEVANALGQLHTLGLLHNDVAARNVLIYHDGKCFTPKLADFGMVTRIQFPRQGMRRSFTSDTEKIELVLNRPETAPEILLNAAYQSVKSDVYSLGHVMQLLASHVYKNGDLLTLANRCHSFILSERPTLHYVIMTLSDIAETEWKKVGRQPVV